MSFVKELGQVEIKIPNEGNCQRVEVERVRRGSMYGDKAIRSAVRAASRGKDSRRSASVKKLTCLGEIVFMIVDLSAAHLLWIVTELVIGRKFGIVALRW